MSHLPSLLIENAVNFPYGYVDRCQAAAVEVAKLLSNLFPTANLNQPAGRTSSVGEERGLGETLKQREELFTVECDLRSLDLRLETLRRAMRQEEEGRKTMIKRQEKLISDINKSCCAPQLPSEVLAHIWSIYQAAQVTYPEANNVNLPGFWNDHRLKEIRNAVGRDSYSSSSFRMFADEISEDVLSSSHPAKLYVTFRDAGKAASDWCGPMEHALQFKERWSTLHIYASISSDKNARDVFMKCAPAWPYLENIVLQSPDLRWPDISESPRPSSFIFSIPVGQVPRSLKSANLDVESLNPLEVFIAGVESLNLTKVVEAELSRLQVQIIPCLPRSLKSLSLFFEPSYFDDQIKESDSMEIQAPDLKTLELAYFSTRLCLKILAPFQGCSLQKLILTPYRKDGTEDVIRGIDALFPRLCFLGLRARGINIPRSYGYNNDLDFLWRERDMLCFIFDAVTLLCDRSADEPIFSNLNTLEIPFPYPCAFERIRKALEDRRSRRNVTQINWLILDCHLQLGENLFHNYCSQSLESLQVIV